MDWSLAALLAVGLGALGGCAREEYTTGSLKDDAPHARAVPRARVAAYAPEPAARVAAGGESVRAAKARTEAAAAPPPAKSEPVAAPVKSAAAPAAAPQPAPGAAATSVARAAPPQPLAPAPSVQPPSAPARPAAAAPPAQAPAPAATAPAASAATTPAPADVPKIAALMKEGRELFAAGKVPDSRLRFFNAMDMKSPEAVHALARSFDTHYLSQLPNNNGVADMQRALRYYQIAADAKQPGAAEDLARIRATLGPSPR